jgi:uncharacterized membrane protein (DUF4010 family)
VRAVRPKADNILQVGRAVTFGIRADLTSYPVVPTGSSDSLKGVDCNISHRQVRSWLLTLLVVLVANLSYAFANLSYAFWGVKLRSGSRHQCKLCKILNMN